MPVSFGKWRWEVDPDPTFSAVVQSAGTSYECVVRHQTGILAAPVRLGRSRQPQRRI